MASVDSRTYRKLEEWTPSDLKDSFETIRRRNGLRDSANSMIHDFQVELDGEREARNQIEEFLEGAAELYESSRLSVAHTPEDYITFFIEDEFQPTVESEIVFDPEGSREMVDQDRIIVDGTEEDRFLEDVIEDQITLQKLGRWSPKDLSTAYDKFADKTDKETAENLVTDFVEKGTQIYLSEFGLDHILDYDIFFDRYGFNYKNEDGKIMFNGSEKNRNLLEVIEDEVNNGIYEAIEVEEDLYPNLEYQVLEEAESQGREAAFSMENEEDRKLYMFRKDRVESILESSSKRIEEYSDEKKERVLDMTEEAIERERELLKEDMPIEEASRYLENQAYEESSISANTAV